MAADSDLGGSALRVSWEPAPRVPRATQLACAAVVMRYALDDDDARLLLGVLFGRWRTVAETDGLRRVR